MDRAGRRQERALRRCPGQRRERLFARAVANRQADLEALLERAAQYGTPGPVIDLRIEEGRHPAQSLCAYASDHVFDLLVLGRHGDGGMLHPRFGHVAKAAATASTVPVLLVSAS